MEEDYWSASRKFWQTIWRLRRGKQSSTNTVYGGGVFHFFYKYYTHASDRFRYFYEYKLEIMMSVSIFILLLFLQYFFLADNKMYS